MKTLYQHSVAPDTRIREIQQQSTEVKAKLNAQAVLTLLFGETFPMQEQQQNYGRGGDSNPLKKKYEFKNQTSLGNLLNPYPNPAGDYFYLPYKAALNGGIVLLHDAMGKLIQSYPMQKGYNILKIESASLEPGLYFLTVKDANDKAISAKKIIVQH